MTISKGTREQKKKNALKILLAVVIVLGIVAVSKLAGFSNSIESLRSLLQTKETESEYQENSDSVKTSTTLTSEISSHTETVDNARINNSE